MSPHWRCLFIFTVLPFAGCNAGKATDPPDATAEPAEDTPESEVDGPGADDTEDPQDTGSAAEPDPDDVDDDGDGVSENEGDCDDTDAGISPDAADDTVDGVDQNCDDFDGVDSDGDGYASADGGGTDCDDGSEAVNPGVEETCNAIDDDCDGTVDSEAVCPCTLSTYGEHNYLYCETEAVWSDARDACTALPNYDLVIINDASEQEWIHGTASSYGNRHWWLGLTDQDAPEEEEPDSGWVWVDGTPMSYSNWSGGQPDDYESREDCAHMDLDADETLGAERPGGWNDLPCAQSLWFDPVYFVCESNRP